IFVFFFFFFQAEDGIRDLIVTGVQTCALPILWLDYDRPLIMARVIRRSVWRAITRKPMWNENRENWRSWADPEHPIRWAWAKHRSEERRVGKECRSRWEGED